MFGYDVYRGNTTPQDRYWRAKDALEDAKHHFEIAQRKFNEANHELMAYKALNNNIGCFT